MKKISEFVKKITSKHLFLYLIGALVFTALVSWLEMRLPEIIPITTERGVVLYFVITEGIVRWVGISEIVVTFWLFIKLILKIRSLKR